jgi:hypothetical protein
MKLSSTPGSPGYAEWKRLMDEGKMVDVHLDGRELTMVTEVDTDVMPPRAVRCKTDPGGSPFCAPGTDEIARETVRGLIKVTVRDRRPGELNPACGA